jgi:hypothetical protein
MAAVSLIPNTKHAEHKLHRRKHPGIPRLPDQSRLDSPHHPHELRALPKADNNGRAMTDRWHLVHAHFGACSEHRLEVLRDVPQRSNSVSPRAREDEPTAVEPPEARPLKLSPRFFKSWERPSSCYM